MLWPFSSTGMTFATNNSDLGMRKDVFTNRALDAYLDTFLMEDRAMRHATRATLLGHTCLLVLALSAAARAQTGEITGQVVSKATGAPLSGASVRVSNPDLSIITGATTGADGRYAVENLPVGTYAVEVTFVGYRTDRSPIFRTRWGANIG